MYIDRRNFLLKTGAALATEAFIPSTVQALANESKPASHVILKLPEAAVPSGVNNRLFHFSHHLTQPNAGISANGHRFFALEASLLPSATRDLPVKGEVFPFRPSHPFPNTVFSEGVAATKAILAGRAAPRLES